jgi:acyl dehydratase
MIDPSWIGREVGRSVLPIEAGRLRFFAKAIGEKQAMYIDELAAQEAGYSALPAPPTFLFAAEMDSGVTFKMLDDMGVPLERILHGEMGFEYFKPVVAGDVVTVRAVVNDITVKKGGALELVEVLSEALNAKQELVARLRSIIVVRN